MESSKATAKHIRQVTGDLPAAQIHLMHYQCTKLPAGNYNKHKKILKQRLPNHSPQNKHQRNSLISRNQKSHLIDASDAVTHHMQKDSNVLQKSFSVKCVINSATSLQSATKRIIRHQVHLSLGNLRHTNFEQGPFTLITMWMAIYLKSQVLMNCSAYR